MPLVTLPPEVIESALAETSQAIEVDAPAGSCGIEVGRFLFGGHYYVVLQGPPSDIKIYKRATLASKPPTDATAWTRMDSAHEPSIGGPPAAVFDGTVIHLLYAAFSTNLLHVNTYDCSTDLYGTPSAAGPNISPVVQPEGKNFQRLSNGNYYVYYTGTPGGSGAGFDTQVFYVSLIAGIWSAPVSVYHYTAHDGWLSVGGGVTDATNVMHLWVGVFVNVPVAPNPGKDLLVLYIQISAAGVVSAAVQIDSWFTNPATVNFKQKFWAGIPVIWQSNKLAFLYTYGDSPMLVFAAIGTGLVTPSWTITDIAGGVGGSNPSPIFPSMALDKDGNLRAIWVGELTDVVDQVWMNINTGSGWVTPVVFYDAIANPPPVSPLLPDPQAHRLGNLKQDVDGTLSLTLTMEAFGPISTAFILFASVGSPLAVTCPPAVTGAVGVPYDSFVGASGGFPPYTFAIIAGALPTGLSLNTSTGEITGTPSVGGLFTFTVQVTDSHGQTATATSCPITISAMPLVLLCPEVLTGMVGVPFSAQFIVTGGTPPYDNYHVIGGSLPPGLTLDIDTGVISGIPTTAGTFTFTVEVSDANDLTARVTCSIVITAGPCCTPLWRQDEFAMDAFNTSWAQAPATRPRAFSVSVTPPVSLQVAPVPLNAGVLDLCVVEGGPMLDPGHPNTLLSVADDLAWAVVFGALSDLLSQDGQSRDPSRAAYCESRYQQAIEVARQLPSGLTTQVNNIPMNTGSVFDLDAFLPNWQCIQGQPRFGGYAGRNLLALGPVPDGIYGITADIVPNIPIPVNDNDFIQAGREDMAYILDYAQHLASFKMGGAEFTATMKLLKNFFAGAVMRNSRLKGTTIDKFDLDVPGGKQQLQYERTEGGSSMPTTNEGS